MRALFVSFKILGYSILAGYSDQILCVAQMGIAVPMSTFSIPKKLGSQLSKSHRRENHL